MPMNKRIGIIIGRIYKAANKRLLSGIVEQARTAGISAYVFTLNEECPNDKITSGEENIFSAINFSLLDGIVLAPYTFDSDGYSSYIEHYLAENCTIPVVRIGIEQDRYISVWYNDRGEMSELTLHLIYGHGCKKILCLTGPEQYEVSRSRAAGYRDAMERADLVYTEDDIIYGDFWVYAAQALAAEIADGRREKPDAVVCANDAMAIALCDALIDKGFSVPEDIRVTGYDGHLDARVHFPAITTYQTSHEHLGRSAMCRLYREISGDDMELCGSDKGVLLCRESCGCNSLSERFDTHEFDYKHMEYSLMDCTLSAALHDVNSLNGFVHNMYAMRHLFMDRSRFGTVGFYLCLCDDWDIVRIHKGKRTYRTSGYSDKMIFISSDEERTTFELSEMLPSTLRRDEPTVTFFIPVHFQERCFGYVCLEATDVFDDFNMNYLRFCREINNGLEFLCAQNELKRLVYRRNMSQSRDELTGLFLLESCPQMWDEVSEIAELYRQDIYIIVISAGGLKHIENAAGSAESDRHLLMFAETLSKCCSNTEKIYKTGEKGFVIIGTESSPVSRPQEYLKAVEERFRQQNIIAGGQYLVYAKSEIRVIPSAKPISSEDAEAGIKAMLARVSENSRSRLSEKVHYGELIELRKEIFRHPETDWNGDECSRRISVSKSYFHKIYNQLFGISFMQDVQHSRLSCAKKLLVTTNDTLPDIAAKCGYDYYNFMRAFKKETGMTPTQFRKKQ
ncbi:MAG: substrate-binding domain-containing protein [Ruminococcus sp.]|nr:substrate-binding domain-containing protein [Ruminococcus sp.]